MTAPHQRSTNRTQAPQLMTDVAGAYQYGVFFTLVGAGMAFRRNLTTGVYETIDLSTVASNRLQLPIIDGGDDHYALTVGVDDADVVHITGNDHDHSATHRYVVCNDVTDFTNAASWASGGSPFAALQGLGGCYTYNLWERTPDGTLLWFLSQSPSPTVNEARDWLGFRRSAGAWVALVGSGIFASTDYSGDPGGSTNPDGSAVQSYMSGLMVDVSGRTHVSGLWRTDSQSADSQQAPWYLYSDDLTTWHTADGTTQSMPVTWANRTAASITTAPAISALFQQGIGLDENGRPHMTYIDGILADPDAFKDYYWDGSAWQEDAASSRAQPWSSHFLRGARWIRKRVFVGSESYISITNQTTGAEVRVSQLVIGSCTPSPDPILLRQGIYSILVPEGDIPRVFTFGDHARMSAA